MKRRKLKTMKRLTPKEQVMKKHPGAYLHKAVGSDSWNVFPAGALLIFDLLGSGTTPKAAWANAAYVVCNDK